MKKKHYCAITVFLALITIYIGSFVFKRKHYCGIIKYKISTVHHNKSQSYDKPLFVVDFKNYGIAEIRPTWNDFMKYNQGDCVCYKLHVTENIGLLTLFIICFISTVMMLVIIFGDIIFR